MRRLITSILVLAACAGDDGPPPPPPGNLVFVTAGGATGDFGGVAAADALCAGEAAAAGRAGTFVAWISTRTGHARDRLAGSRGWVNLDGEPVIDTVEDWLDRGQMFNPITHDDTISSIWTGSGPDGRLDRTLDCGGWTDNLGDGAMGDASTSMPLLDNSWNWPCYATVHFACFEIGKAEPVAPVPDPTATRYAFVSRLRLNGGGLAGYDTICHDEAAAAGLPGTYKAAVATTTASIADRFVVDDRAWRRVDGTRFANADLLRGGAPLSFANQQADGTYTTSAVVTGTRSVTSPAGNAQNSCSDWTITDWTLIDTGFPGASTARTFWGGVVGNCHEPYPVLCLQE